MDTNPQLSPRQYAHSIKLMCHNVAGFMSVSGEKAADDSIYLKDVQSYAMPEAILTLLSQANLSLTAAEDHLLALAVLLDNDVPSMAVWACARGAIESAALATWLLDPTTDTRSRVQRSLALRFEDLN